MKPQDIIAALAELDGKICNRCKGTNKYYEYGKHEWFRMKMGENSPYKGEQPLKDCDHLEHEGDYFPPLPNYLHSYDAIVPLIQKQPKEIRERIAEELWAIHNIDSDWSEQEAWAKNFLTTTSQLCEALLRAHNKWKE